MSSLPKAISKNKYSWLWDSHISPKNSKWLQENLSDMDSTVKQMIKLIEEDADSFAIRAEMYYKKRPELMELVEEFYRAYRALAERYDHATGVIRQAHRTMPEAFPNQIAMMDETDAEPHTPDVGHLSHTFLETYESQNDASTKEPDSAITKIGLKQLNDLILPEEKVNIAKFAVGHARRELNFIGTREEGNTINNESHDSGTQVVSESERVTKAVTEVTALKEALAKLESEKEAGLHQYQQSLEKLSNMELEVSHARQKSQGLDARARKAESEAQVLKEALGKLQAEREVSLNKYQEFSETISNLEKQISFAQKDAGELNERATRAETEAESLKQDLARVEVERDVALVQYKQCLESLSKLEERSKEAEDNARRINEQADKSAKEIEALKLKVAKLTEEKEDAALHYQQCLEIISILEHKLSCAEEEMHALNSKVEDGAEKLHSSEQKYLLLEASNQTMQSELQSLAQKLASQSEELSEKQRELGTLWASLQEERSRFITAETAFQTLQNLHSESQENLRSLAADLHGKVEILENVESQKHALEHEVHRVKEENKILNENKISSSLSIKKLQDEILNLREIIEKLEKEVKLRSDEREALQQEIYRLKEDLIDLNKRHEAMLEEVRSTGLDPHCFGSSVKQLQDGNSKLKETYEAIIGVKDSLLAKPETMEKNYVLENSLSDLNAEMESVRGKVKVLEETCQSLLEEKSTLAADKDTLFSELQVKTEKLEKLSEKNYLLENSLFAVNAELEGLRVKSKILEDRCQLLDDEKSSIISEKETLVYQLNISQKALKDLEKQCNELELKHLELKGKRESALQKVEELLVLLDFEREEHTRVMKLNEDDLAEKELQIHTLKKDVNFQKKEHEDELDRAVHAQTEIFILQKYIHDLEEKNLSLLVERERLLEASKMAEKMILKLKTENVQKRVDLNSLSEARGTLEDQASQILKFSSNKYHKNEKLQCLSEVNQKVESEIRHLYQELGETKLREEELSYELRKGTDEIEQWETQAETLYVGLLISAVNETLFEGKVSELADACENLECQNYTKDMENKLLKETVMKLEDENRRLRSHLAAYVPAISALNDCITSLEMHTLVHAKPHEHEESKVQDSVNHRCNETGIQTGDDHTLRALDALLDFQDMTRRTIAIERAVKQINGSFKPEDEIRGAKENQHGPSNEIGVPPKDIMLDQISECSSYGISRRGTFVDDNKMLELCETADEDAIIEVDIRQGEVGYTEQKNKYPSSESLVEKELGVDKLEISGRLAQPHEEGNRSEVLERLDSDAQKLTNLQITIQDLMKKVEITKTGKKGKSVEYDSAKYQLEAAQETITKLLDANHKLKKNVEDCSVSFGERTVVESGEIESVSRRRVTEYARRGSEEIGQLQIEVQRLQFLLLKLNGGNESKEKAKVADYLHPNVLLRDYLYGRTRTNNQKKKKRPCLLACFQTHTKED